MSSKEQAQLYMLKGMLADLSEEEQEKFNACKKELHLVMQRHDLEMATAALGFVALEWAVKNE